MKGPYDGLGATGGTPLYRPAELGEPCTFNPVQSLETIDDTYRIATSLGALVFLFSVDAASSTAPLLIDRRRPYHV